MLFGGGKRGILPQLKGQPASTVPQVRTDALILVVDDDATSRAAIINLLEGQGYRVHALGTYAAWTEAWRSGPAADLVVLDVMLSERQSGYEILRALRSEDGQTPVVMVSSRNTPTDSAFARAHRANAFVSKVQGEFNHPDRGLVATVNRLLTPA